MNLSPIQPSKTKSYRSGVTAIISAVQGLDILRTVALRVLSMLMGFLVNIITVRLITGRFGSDGYAAFALLASILTALPFADLGTGAGIVNLTSDLTQGKLSWQQYTRGLRTAARFLVAAALVVSSFVAYLTIWGKWSFLLSSLTSSPGASAAAAFIGLMVAVMMPMGIGSRILQGMGRVVESTRWSLTAAPIQLAVTGALFAVRAPAAYYGVGIAIAALGSNLGTCWSAAKALRPVRERAIDGQKGAHVPVTHAILPYFLTLLGGLAAFQLSRIRLLHVSTAESLSEFSFVAQFVLPLLSVIAMASQNLWPMFRQRRDQRTLTLRIFAMYVSIYAAMGIAGACTVWLIVVLFAHLVTSGTISVAPTTLVWAGAYLVASSTLKPVSMMLSSINGLWAQACTGVASAGVTFVLTGWLGVSLGASGAYAACAIGLIVVQGIPLMWIGRRSISSTKGVNSSASTSKQNRSAEIE